MELFPGPPEVDFLWSLLPLAPGSGLLVGARGLWRFRDGRFTREPAPAALANGSILALYRDRRGHLWVGTYRLGVFRRTPEEGWHHLAPGTSGMPDAAVRAFLETRDGLVWMATTGGGVLRWRDGRLERLSRADGLPSGPRPLTAPAASGWAPRTGASPGSGPPGARRSPGPSWRRWTPPGGSTTTASTASCPTATAASG